MGEVSRRHCLSIVEPVIVDFVKILPGFAFLHFKLGERGRPFGCNEQFPQHFF